VQACGYTPQTDIRFSGLQAVPTTTRIIRQSSRTDDASLTSADVFSLQLIDKAKEAAIVATPKIRPIRITSKAGAGGGRRDYNATLTDKYVMYIHPFQVTDLRQSTSTGQWLDISKAAMTGGEITNNPIYTGAIH
jgi:N4-gp56 family major capsid protein